MNVIENIRKKFSDKVKVDLLERSKKRIFLTVEKENAREVVGYLYEQLGARFSTASGVDTRDGVEIIYHMALDKEGLFVSVRTLVDKPALKMDTFTDFLPACNWIEREMHEMLGVDFKGHPNLSKLLLPDDWPDGEYPFRKKTFGSQQEGMGK